MVKEFGPNETVVFDLKYAHKYPTIALLINRKKHMSSQILPITPTMKFCPLKS
jgi:hypothetical protein